MWSFPFERNHRRRRLEHNHSTSHNEESRRRWSNPSPVQNIITTGSIENHPPIQRNLPEFDSLNNKEDSNAWIPSALQLYPVTCSLLLAIGIAHIFRPRRRSQRPLTYRALVEHKQWFRWWSAAFSLPYYVSRMSGLLPRWTHREHGSWWWWLSGILGTGRRLWSIVRHLPRDSIGTGLDDLWRWTEVIRPHLVLLYIGHLLWSCRGLEEYYHLLSNSDEDVEEDPGFVGDALTYLRVWLGLALCATLFEVVMIYWVLLLASELRRVLLQRGNQRANSSRTEEGVVTPAVIPPLVENPSIPGEEEEDPNLRTLREYDTRLHSQRLAVNVVLVTSALLMVHRMRLPHVPILPLPFGTSWMGPNVSYAACLWVLFRLLTLGSARSSASAEDQQRDASSVILRTMIHGTFIGWLWSHYWEFLASAYWGNAWLLVGIVGSMLSLRAKYSRDVPCLPTVGCNARGRPLIYDASAQRWLSDSENDDDGEENRIPLDLEGAASRDGVSSTDDDDQDVVLDETAPLLPPGGGGVELSNVRSRRNASLLPIGDG